MAGEMAKPRQVLVVDDSGAQRRVLALALLRQGYQVAEADTAEAALALCRQRAFDFILSDWVMPGLSGPDFCRRFRQLPQDSYGYFILLTSKSEKGAVARGLDLGADDYLTKPVDTEELLARLRAGERILGMQREVMEKNRLIGRTLAELQALYDGLDRDLIEARRLQQTMLRERYRDFGRGAASILFQPSGHVGGDLAGFFTARPGRLVLYSIDVSGHGLASAMMTARLAGHLSGAVPGFATGPPERVAARFNRMMLEEMQVEQYFTMVYAEVDLDSGQVQLVQAGHPHPVILRAAGGVERIGSGGLPIGLLPAARFERVEARLAAGDRLFLLSDGVTECAAADGRQLGLAGLADVLRRNAGLEDRALLAALVQALQAHAGAQSFADDVSGVLFRYRG